MDPSRLTTTYKQDFIPSDADELAAHDAMWDEYIAWGNAEWEKSKVEMVRHYEEQGVDPDSAKFRVEWVAWRMEEVMKNLLLYGTVTPPEEDNDDEYVRRMKAAGHWGG